MRERSGQRERRPSVPPAAELLAEPPRPGLRERKKAKTRAAIQRHALRLFKRRGYDETTVEDIAEAAEVSPSTFFRYFRTKEDVVLYDVLDPVLLASIRAQPRSLGPLETFRRAVRSAFDDLDPDEREDLMERETLFRAVPELRARVLDELLRSVTELCAVFAERARRRADDLAVRVVVGAITGALVAAWLTTPKDQLEDVYTLMDRAIEKLESGLSL